MNHPTPLWKAVHPDGTAMTEYDEYGYIVDEYGHQIGWCNSCGEEAEADTECCEDGEVVPYND